MSEAGVIQRLDETVVNRIAAGEVVQRPANALKEMLENCLDAKSTQISVTVKQGGLKLLQIQDNGTGIRKCDLDIVCERFTTSKLRQFGDLQQISTYGFRGEALASISHVAHLTIITKTKDEKCAWKCSYIDSKPKAPPKPCAGNQGTQIIVEDLFYNVPTRRKALRSAAEEHARIAEVMSRYAVHNCSVGFSLKKQGESGVVMRTAPKSTNKDNICTLFGSTVAKELLQVSCEDDRLQFSCEGLVSNANYSAKRCTMLLFINHRLVDSTPLRKAVEAVYNSYLPKQGHPFMYLSLVIAPQNVDVNVHPTKHEVAFLHEDAIVEAVQKAVEKTLLGSNASRTFYTQSLLPGATAVPAASSCKETSGGTATAAGETPQRVYDHSLVRTDAKEQKLTKYLSRSVCEDREGASSTEVIPKEQKKVAESAAVSTKQQKTQASEKRRQICLTSVQRLLHEVSQSCHRGLHDILRQHVFVGCVSAELALLQHGTGLYLARTRLLCEQMFYQMMLNDFGNFGVIKLSTPCSVRALCLLALQLPESGWTASDGPKEDLADYTASFLHGKAAMLEDYFSLAIDERGDLCTLPYLLDDFVPCMSGLPLYVLRLTTEVSWDAEEDCFRTFCQETARFYSAPPLPGDDEDEQTTWQSQVEKVVYPALKRHLLPPNHLAHDTSLLQLADLHQLYKVFERC